MSTFDDREHQFEAAYTHDQELQFKVHARRNRLLGEWAADRMQLTGDARAAYAKEVVSSDFEKPGDDDVLQKVLADLNAKGVTVDARDVRIKMDELLMTAKKQIMAA